jgi:hypothetical protein
LEQETHDTIQDSIGDTGVEWVKVADLTGIVQNEDVLVESFKGQLESPGYRGFFVADFEIPIDDISKYRIKQTIPYLYPLVRYYKVKEIVRNFILNKKRHHYEIVLEINKKWS